MLEAVGAEYFETFFEVCDRALAPGGKMSLQTITFPDVASSHSGMEPTGSRPTIHRAHLIAEPERRISGSSADVSADNPFNCISISAPQELGGMICTP